MKLTLHRLALAVWLGLLCLGAAAQENPAPDDASSREVEKSDEDFRRRMELEDARQRNLGYTLPPETYAQQQEKIDKLPEESRDHIRDQLIEVIVENGEWEPSDALRDYPYEPTAAALADPELLQRENEAWNEQIEKYHRREAAAFGSYHGPVAGPGNPQGADQPGQQGQGPQAGLSGDGGAGAGGNGSGQTAADGSEGAAGGGTYEPYQANRKSGEERVSTAGVQQSALDFLQGQQGGNATGSPASSSPEVPGGAPGDAGSPEAESPRTEPPEAEAGEADAENAAAAETASERDLDLSTPGLIAIEDLDKLEGAESETDEAD
jgi:hypothetical protein